VKQEVLHSFAKTKLNMRRISIIALACLFTLAPIPLFANPSLPYIAQSTEMRGLWVTSAYNLDWPSRQGLSPAELKAEIDDILARAAAQHINAVFVQVRPVGDALYNSSIFPWSHLISGTQGVAPANNFDPLAYWVQQAHALGIEVHAWLNPFRVTFPNQNITNPVNLSANHPARLNPSLIIAYRSSLFFDPGNPVARQLVVDGAAELLRNYNIDGIHLDDYFYPSRDFPDQATFARYGGGMDIHDWRRENINALIRDLQSITHQINPNASFGVSPFAIWQNNDRDPRGSATGGLESFHAHYADTRRWVIEGWVDYIVPQIYWIEGNTAACYEVVLSWWENLVAGTGVRLYIGLAPYREVTRETDPRFANWREGEIVGQLERNARSPVVNGSIFFREQFMRSDVGDAVGRFYTNNLQTRPAANIPPPTIATRQIPPVIKMDRLFLAQPSSATRTVTDANGFFMFGSAVAGVPVYVNGQLITDRTAEGFFSVFLPLVRGQNVFTFTQAGQPDVTRTIVNNAPAPPGAPATMAVGITNTFPTTDEWARPGTTLTLRATAPAGATVTAEIGGQTVTLTQSNANLTATAANIVAAQFTGNFTLNTVAADDAVIDIGRPVYTMTWNGETRTETADGHIRQLGINAPRFAEVTSDSVWVFPQAGTTGGSNLLLQRGQVDRIAAISGNWTRLVSGGWVQNEYIRTWRDTELVPEQPTINRPNSPDLGFLSEGRYIAGQYWDTITWASPFFPAVQTEFDGSVLILSLGMQNIAPPIFHTPGNTLFSDIRMGTHNGTAAYFMTLREGANLEGFYTTYVDGELRLILRHRRPLTKGDYPFAGFTFIIDAGHGGTDPGALGPMGAEKSESDLVLIQANMLTTKLEALGANIVRSRDTDTYYSLQQRVDLNRATSPDMFISLHTNATAETTDATNIRGFTVWYRNENSHPAANLFMENMYNVNPGTNRNRAPSQANFFVCRPMWSPAILLEASFTNNIHDFSWMICPNGQEDYVRAIVNTLLAYYR